jgi:murein DD-endopeptidase MepM/ murein hydrolase activator NlpD
MLLLATSVVGFRAPPIARAEPLRLVLPTDNDGLLTGHPADFYQYVRRDFEGAQTLAWEGGQYGFVRNPHRFGAEVIYTRFHEGIDIRPLHRDARGEPEDVVGAIAPGEVVYVNAQPGASNYGRYVVVEHQFDGCPYFSLYAHLQSVTVQTGNRVEAKAALGIMGHSGEGVDRERAHVHLELNLMLNAAFDAWYNQHFPGDGNRHGLYNGMNLDGIDLGRLYPALQRDPDLTIPQFLHQETVWYRVRVPASTRMDILDRYPWLSPQGRVTPPAWEIAFAQSGVPLDFEPVQQQVPSGPELVWVHPSPYPQQMLTRGYLHGIAPNCTLSPEGLNYLDLICPKGMPQMPPAEKCNQ